VSYFRPVRDPSGSGPEPLLFRVAFDVSLVSVVVSAILIMFAIR